MAGTGPALAADRLLLQLSVNGRSFEPSWMRAAPPSGPHYAPAADVRAWGVVIINARVHRFDGDEWYCLEEMGAEVMVDMKGLSGDIRLPAQLFAAQEYLAVPLESMATTRATGGFLNYDVRGERIEGAGSVGVALETGWFGPRGMLISSAVSRADSLRMVRLDSVWRYDDERRIASWIAGDTITSTGPYARSVRIAGLQYARNFSNQPLLVTYPTARVEGVATVPSTVDVIVNNARTYRTEVLPGAYSISALPTPTGAGEVRVIVRDILGRETQSVVPFVSNEEMLKEGLADFSYELGALREDYGSRNFAYGDPVAVASHRYGVNDWFTVGGRLELADDRANLGGTAQWVVPIVGIVGASYARSVGNAGQGRQGNLGLLAVRHRSPNFAIGGLIERRSAGFVDIADSGGGARLRERNLLYASWSSRGRWSLGAQWLRARYSSGELTIGSLSWSWSLLRRVSLTMSLMRTSVSGDHDLAGTAFFSVPFWRRSYVSASVEHTQSAHGHDAHATIQFGRNIAQDESWGYDARYSRSGTDQHWGWRGIFQSDKGQFGVSVEENEHLNFASAYMRGGIALAGGSVALSRHLDSSFAIVQVGDFPGVQLYSNGQPAVRTNRSGEAVLPSLTPFVANVVSFEPNDLPLEASVHDNRLRIKLPARMGARVTMPVGRELSATLTLLEPDGQPVPAGARIMLEGGSDTYYVGHEGYAFVGGLARDTVHLLRVQGDDYECSAQITLPPEFSSGNTLGTITCE